MLTFSTNPGETSHGGWRRCLSECSQQSDGDSVDLYRLLLLIAFIQRYSPLSSRLTALACDST